MSLALHKSYLAIKTCSSMKQYSLILNLVKSMKVHLLRELTTFSDLTLDFAPTKPLHSTPILTFDPPQLPKKIIPMPTTVIEEASFPSTAMLGNEHINNHANQVMSMTMLQFQLN